MEKDATKFIKEFFQKRLDFVKAFMQMIKPGKLFMTSIKMKKAILKLKPLPKLKLKAVPKLVLPVNREL